MPVKVHLLKNGYANCFLLEEDGLVLVDTGMKWKKNKLKQEFRELNLKPEDVQLIILTHGHKDHLGGLPKYLEVCGNPPVLCHQKAATALRTGKSSPVKGIGLIGKLIAALARLNAATGFTREPEKTITTEADLQDYGISARAVPTPGHTRGSLSILLEDGSAVLGDTVMPGKGHKPGRPFFIENTDWLRESYSALIPLLKGFCYTGHGGPYRAEDVISMMMREVSRKI